MSAISLRILATLAFLGVWLYMPAMIVVMWLWFLVASIAEGKRLW